MILPDGYELREGFAAMQLEKIHDYLASSYWSPGISVATVERAMKNSVCVGMFFNDIQIGYARVITDKTTFGYLADVYILSDHAGKGLAKAMVAYLQVHPDLQGLRRWLLATRDAHGLYAGLGWQPLADPMIFMQRHFPDAHK